MGFEGKTRTLATRNRDIFEQFAHLLGVSTKDLVWILGRGGELHEKRLKSIEAVRTNARLRNKGSGVAGAPLRGLEGQSLGRIVAPAGPERASRESRHKVMPHYRLQDAKGRYLRLDGEGLAGDSGSAWIGTETQLLNAVKRFPLAQGMRPIKVQPAKVVMPVNV